MKVIVLTVLISIVAMISACVEPPPRRDPFAGLNTASATMTTSTYKDLSLALVLSDNTKETIPYIGTYAREYELGLPLGIAEAGDSSLSAIAAALQRNFKTVVKVESVTEAKTVNADLAVVLDVYARLAKNRLYDTNIDVRAFFLTLDGKQVEEINVSGQGVEKYGFFDWAKGKIDEASADVTRKLESSLIRSSKLAEFSKARTGAAAVVAAKPQAPPIAGAPATRVTPSDVDNPIFDVTTRIMGDNDIAIVIGVEKYQDLPASDFSSRDAKLVKEYLVSLGVRERNIELLLNERATGTSIRKAVESWLPNRVKKDSRVFLYYSGHGAPEPSTGEAYVVPHDGDANYLSTTGYPLKVLYEKLGGLPAGEVVVVLDACFSGAGGRSVLAKGARPLVLMKEGPALASNMAVLAATQGTQISTSSPEKGHGILTYYFLKAIKDGKKDLAEIYGTIRPQVEDEAKLLNVTQIPSLNPDPSRLQGKFRLRK